MASQLHTHGLTEKLTCPVCLDLFTDPVILECSHSFCRSCITRCWEKQGVNTCPVCQEPFPERNLRTNRNLDLCLTLNYPLNLTSVQWPFHRSTFHPSGATLNTFLFDCAFGQLPIPITPALHPSLFRPLA
uniref:RING-type domain-containing protein n=1 Tax=Callorhinchus milii TaxID=7868 RepID=A0A4W3H818_CALMI